MAWPSAARARRTVDQTGLRRVVQAAGRLVEEQQRRAGGQDDRQGEGEALALGQVAGVGVVRDAGQQRVDQGPAGAGGRARVVVGGGALGGDGVRVQEVAGFLGDQADVAQQFAGAGAVRGRAADPDRAGGRLDACRPGW